MTDEEIRKQIIAERRRKMNRKRIIVFCIAAAVMLLCGLAAGSMTGIIISKVHRAEPVIDTSVPIVEIAAEQIGNVGGEPYWSWSGFDSHVEWCACFASWCADQAGYIESGIAPKFSSVGDGISWFAGRGLWEDGSATPSAGDYIFFDWENDDYRDHVGIVAGVKDGIVYTIEGNSSDRVRIKRYKVGSPVINGYGHVEPKQEEE